jgi:hypothetical protein
MSYVREPRHTLEEYERYAPIQYGRFEIVLRILKYLLLIFAIGLAYVIGKGEDVPPWVGWTLGSIAIAFLIAGIVLPGLTLQLDYLVDEALRKERDALQTKVAKMQDDIKSVAAKMRDIKAKGSVVVAGGGNTVIIGSAISDSFNAIKHDDPALAEALATISGAVEKSGNKEAGQAWASFMKQATGERDKTVLSALWDRVVKLVPDIASLAESAAKIATLFIA